MNHVLSWVIMSHGYGILNGFQCVVSLSIMGLLDEHVIKQTFSGGLLENPRTSHASKWWIFHHARSE